MAPRAAHAQGSQLCPSGRRLVARRDRAKPLGRTEDWPEVTDAAYDVHFAKKLARPDRPRALVEWERVHHVRLVLARVLALLFAASWIVFPGFGLVDLSVTWSSDWPQVLEAGWGLFFTVLVGLAFVVVAARPRSAGPAVAQLAVATIALAVSVVAGREAALTWVPILLAVETLLVAWLCAPAWRARTASRGVDVPMLALAALGVVPWLAYAVEMWNANREGRPDSDITNAIDHYSVQGALGLALAVLPALAALRPALIPLAPVCAGIAAAYLGLVSFAWEDAAGGFGRTWSVAATAWGLCLVAVSLTAAVRRSRRAVG
jgi:hypothetical protein